MERLLKVINAFKNTDCRIKHLEYRVKDSALFFYRKDECLISPEDCIHDVEYKEVIKLKNIYGLSLYVDESGV